VDGLYLVDWEYSAMGDPAWDLAILVVEASSGQIPKEHALDRLDHYQRLFDSARVRDAVARLRG
jgi:thiamine kinase-like enzyme